MKERAKRTKQTMTTGNIARRGRVRHDCNRTKLGQVLTSPLLSNVTDRHDRHPDTPRQKRNREQMAKTRTKKRGEGMSCADLRHSVAVVKDDHSPVGSDSLVELLLGLAFDDDRSHLVITCHGTTERAWA